MSILQFLYAFYANLTSTTKVSKLVQNCRTKSTLGNVDYLISVVTAFSLVRAGYNLIAAKPIKVELEMKPLPTN